MSAHEKSMREQAKKMNVASLRSAENSQKSAEGKLAKVRDERPGPTSDSRKSPKGMPGTMLTRCRLP